jgi:DNA-binding NarL/FixJ family response regulator
METSSVLHIVLPVNAEAACRNLPIGRALEERFRCLSRREIEVFSLLVCGLSAPRIAAMLFISERTVETHVKHIYLKLNVKNRWQAMEKATPFLSGASGN